MHFSIKFVHTKKFEKQKSFLSCTSIPCFNIGELHTTPKTIFYDFFTKSQGSKTYWFVLISQCLGRSQGGRAFLPLLFLGKIGLMSWEKNKDKKIKTNNFVYTIFRYPYNHIGIGVRKLVTQTICTFKMQYLHTF